MLKKYLSGTKAFFRLHLDRIRNYSGTSEAAGEATNIIMELETNGYVIIPEFLEPKSCEQLVVDIDQLLDKYGEDCWRDGTDSDRRLFGFNFLTDYGRDFLSDDLIAAVTCGYLNWKSLVGYTMANRVQFCAENKGSGGGWHRDSSNYRDLKTIVYLSDVEPENGPFQYVRKSHRIEERTKLIFDHGPDFAGKRFNGETAKVIESLDENVLLTGRAGTLIIADTSGIHRGKPLESGSRYAMTNYFWENEEAVPPRMTEIIPAFMEQKLEILVR